MDNDSKYSVIIVGGGPVGLLLGALLIKAGISCRILEQNAAPTPDSRSFGIHPPSLEILSSIGLAKSMVQEGCCIRRGHAFTNTQPLGTLSFSSYPSPFNFILSLPQNRTEQLLEQHLQKLREKVLLRGATVVDISEKGGKVFVTYLKDQQPVTIKADYLVGCDGKESFVRKTTGITFAEKKYPDTYVMGDFTDTTSFGNDAAIYLCDEGVIESFPLPDNQRRWVVKTKHYILSNQRSAIEESVSQRINRNLSQTEHSMVSSFGVQRCIAKHMVRGRIILAGDAAHVVSPIGGQGMNLGWLGVDDLAQCLQQILINKADPGEILDSFERRRKKAVANAARRSEFNMRLGRRVTYPRLRNRLVAMMLSPPLSKFMAQLFAMRGIERWIT
ncbi:FAD-dependent oxidoreductase [Fodinibius salsisoli]|uniref:FAD-dependent monooxygenase n=1 Tax=Fodinibius salsisoli TaxID=2820877 RepID=A0ABT3PNK3_9BACT|nr:NAD(P)/FAD-dependent oxidoreductase [Fodinibius salsisoli]MCW9707444.1 FAD-dependent monooxygenase [Fodinibius salsisoli]